MRATRGEPKAAGSIGGPSLVTGAVVAMALWLTIRFDASRGTTPDWRLAVWIAAAMALMCAVHVFLVSRSTARLEKKVADLEFDALHDGLTGLPNRRLFDDRVAQCARERLRGDSDAAVVLVDLDGFKQINESIGQAAADRLIADVARRLGTRLRRSDTLARLGGDEFAVLLPTVDGEAGARTIAEALRAALATPFTSDGVTVAITASTSIAMMDEQGTSAKGMLQRADRSMYRAKSNGTGIAVYEHEADGVGRDELALISDLRRAISSGELRLHYQPKASLANHKIRSVEALIRWEHPTRGFLTPNVFIPLAERSGLMTQMTYWVIDEALRQTREWADGGVGVKVAVNLSQSSLLDPGITAEIARAFERHGVPAKALEIEITESALVSDLKAANAALSRLDEMGIALSIDDYGTGHSSLSHVRGLPVSCIKIDRSFVSGMLANTKDAAIVRSTIDLAKDLDISVVAEGVETMEEWEALADLGCHLAQGFLISRPKPGTELLEWLSGTGFMFRMDAKFEGSTPMPDFT